MEVLNFKKNKEQHRYKTINTIMQSGEKLFIIFKSNNLLIKNLLIYFLIVIIISSCASSEKLVVKGRYDEAINKAVRKIAKNPKSTKDILALEKAYNEANRRDNERIKFLKLEGKPESWDKIFVLYNNLKMRQSHVRTVLPLNVNGRRIDFEYIDYDREIINAKRQAGEYFFEHAKRLMQEDLVESYRKAYYELLKAKEYLGDISDISQLIATCRFKGVSRVLIRIENRSMYNLPQEYLNDLLGFSTSNINSEWIEYHTKVLNSDIYYNYLVLVTIQNVVVSPDKVNEKDYVVKKEVPDGYQYVLDKKGNVMKDSAGNDIKVAKFKTLQCSVIEKQQQKLAEVNGKMEFISNQTKSLIKTVPVGASTKFEYLSARAIGDIDALSLEQRKLVSVKPQPFPSDIDMIFRTTETFQGAIRDALFSNRNLLK
jgi:hypothetical protein